MPAATYNVARGTPGTCVEVVELLVELAALRDRVVQDPARLRSTDIPVVCGDASRLAEATGWSPEIPLEQTLADALDEARRVGSDGGDSRRMSRRALITGITGQDGSYLAELLLDEGYEVVGMVRRASTENFERIAHLVDRITLVQGDLLDQLSLVSALEDTEPTEVYNLAAQSFVPTSWSQPVLTAEFTAVGVTRMLEAIRAVDPDDPLLPGLVLGDVRQGAGGAAERADAVLPAVAVRRGEGIRPLHHRQLPRVLRPLRGVGDPLQPRVARGAGSSS